METLISLDDASNKVDEIFERVAAGETFIIHVEGKGYAQLKPYTEQTQTNTEALHHGIN